MENCISQNATGNAQHDINVFCKEQLNWFKMHADRIWYPRSWVLGVFL